MADLARRWQTIDIRCVVLAAISLALVMGLGMWLLSGQNAPQAFHECDCTPMQTYEDGVEAGLHQQDQAKHSQVTRERLVLWGLFALLASLLNMLLLHTVQAFTTETLIPGLIVLLGLMSKIPGYKAKPQLQQCAIIAFNLVLGFITAFTANKCLLDMSKLAALDEVVFNQIIGLLLSGLCMLTALMFIMLRSAFMDETGIWASAIVTTLIVMSGVCCTITFVLWQMVQGLRTAQQRQAMLHAAEKEALRMADAAEKLEQRKVEEAQAAKIQALEKLHEDVSARYRAEAERSATLQQAEEKARQRVQEQDAQINKLNDEHKAEKQMLQKAMHDEKESHRRSKEQHEAEMAAVKERAAQASDDERARYEQSLQQVTSDKLTTEKALADEKAISELRGQQHASVVKEKEALQQKNSNLVVENDTLQQENSNLVVEKDAYRKKWTDAMKENDALQKAVTAEKASKEQAERDLTKEKDMHAKAMANEKDNSTKLEQWVAMSNPRVWKRIHDTLRPPQRGAQAGLAPTLAGMAAPAANVYQQLVNFHRELKTFQTQWDRISKQGQPAESPARLSELIAKMLKYQESEQKDDILNDDMLPTQG